jgi:16S rRNA (guanine(966)-N(2))-methyltransferase RsmD
MRIIGGRAARHALKAPKGYAVRPTPDLVKQAVFNSLSARVPGARVLELFAGSGALGLECLSRGAALVVAVEKSSRHALVIRENLRQLGLPVERFELRTQDVFPVISQLAALGREFDLILADPPFGPKNVGRRSESLSQQLLDHAELPRLLARDGLFVLGHTRRDTLSLPTGWEEVKTLKHGDSMMRFLRRSPSPPAVEQGLHERPSLSDD